MRSDAAARSLLERRAAQLARRPPVPAQAAQVDTLTVRVAGHTYGIEARHVRRILRNDRLCRLPAGPWALLGLAAVGGESVPVVDLAAVLGVGPADRARPFLLVLHAARRPLALLVDEAASLERRPQVTVRRPAGAAETTPRLERGVTPDGVVILDVPALLNAVQTTGYAIGAATSAPPPQPQEPGQAWEE